MKAWSVGRYLNFSSCVVAQRVDWLLPPAPFCGLRTVGFLGEGPSSNFKSKRRLTIDQAVTVSLSHNGKSLFAFL